MSVTVRELAAWVEGECLGDADVSIEHARPLADARPGDITFVESDRYLEDWHHCRASAAIVRPSVSVNGRPIIRVADPLMAFASIMKRLNQNGAPHTAARIHPTASVHPTAIIGNCATIGPFSVVGEGSILGDRATLHPGVVVGNNCRIGNDATLFPHVVLYDGCVLGNRVTIHANTVIGADGFGYRPSGDHHVKVPQLGYVDIGDDVEIGANTTIDRGTFGATKVGTGTKIDNLVQVAHNVQLGNHNLIVSQAGVAGSCVTGDYVVLAGQAGIADHIRIGDRTQVGAQCGVIQDLPADERVFGTPARPIKECFRLFHSAEKLPELIRDVKRLKEGLK